MKTLFLIIFSGLINTLSYADTGSKSSQDHAELELQQHLEEILRQDQVESKYAVLGNGQKIHYLTKGNPKKPLIIFLHGFPEFSLAWKNQLKELGKNHFVVAPDMRGYGLSGKPKEVTDYHIDNLTEDIYLLAKSLSKNKKFTLVAHDWGGVVAWNYAYDFPTTLKKLVILNGPHPYVYRSIYNDPTSDQQKKSAYIDNIRSGITQPSVLKSNDCYLLKKIVFSELGEAKDFFSNKDIELAFTKSWEISGALESQLNYYKMLVYPPTPIPATGIEAKKIRVPTLIIWGTQDQWISQDNIKDENLQKYLENFQVIKIPSAGHWIIHEASTLVNEKLIEFLK